MIPLGEQPIYLAGNGRVGQALRRHLNRRHIRYRSLHRGWEENPPRTGTLFLAVPDREVLRALSLHYPEIKGSSFRIVHFAAGHPIVRRGVHLLHPFASIDRDTDLADIRFVWFGHHDTALGKFLEEIGLHTVTVKRTPSTGYHTAAVLLGNFTQYLYLAAEALLAHEKIPARQIGPLLRQLLATSIRNVEQHGIAGLTGPAARGDIVTINREWLFLDNTISAPRLAAVYREISAIIAEALQDGSILR